MRQIKNFMEAKRPMWNCNECKCITMQCWKESEAFCGCGEWGSPLPPLHNVIDATSETSAKMLYDWGENYVEVSIDMDPETWESRVEAIPHWIFADEKYTIDDYNGRRDLFTWFDTEVMRYIIENLEELPSDLFTLFNAYYQNPTEANEQAAYEAVLNRYPSDWW